MARIDAFVALLTCAAIAGGGAAGCSKPPVTPGGNDQIRPTYDQKTGRLEKITYDRNRDGKVDAWTFMNGTRIERAELDENHDGIVDRWEHYEKGDGAVEGSPSGNPATGVLTRVEESMRRDGKVSRREYYEKGQRARAEEDTDGDGRVDKWETWANGALSAVLLDTNADGTPDRRILYPADGSAPRFEMAGADGTFPPVP
jgi:hypothetical protein